MKKLVKTTLILLSLLFSALAFSAIVNDAELTEKVKASITNDKALTNAKINVSTADGIVSLTGVVDSETQASRAIEDAQSVTGVRDTDTSHLSVTDSQQPMTDSYITAKIKGMYIQQKLFGDKDIAAMGISVETNNGVVSLSGTVDNLDQANNAVKIAKTVSGVKEVKSTIKIGVINNDLN